MLIYIIISNTNRPESFHRTYDHQFHNVRPSTHVIIQILKETQIQTRSIIWSISNEKIKKIAKMDSTRIEYIVKVYNKYTIHMN